MRIWIKDFSAIALPLVNLTRKNINFIWQNEHDEAMKKLKDAITTSSTLAPIDYVSSRAVYLSVDSSFHTVGWILSQDGQDGQRHPSRFSSIAWNECESCYNQRSSYTVYSVHYVPFEFTSSV